ncbi:MAG: phosphatidylserine decarboxylase family protein [Runella slithyformis]|nr:MAG: phosphatidylserine decarboxylase family protein [Runella slithyformis]TAF25652.1 MAG: phosphatidylserine decarboxylase family protein [Runella slithyformis]TAF43997.1 MAG: phosphatidylserine decarboxylase family protein [Runella slithyformis]TAF79935.1 MAG: phosphatidylserine decarboxylase family protein [Runella slithyformis]TAH08581.1 MAG: phosphatidylserine decarboxylase family protein [Runella slithyformis]
MTIHKEGYGLILGTAVAVLVSNLLLRQFAGDITWLTTLWLVASLIFFFIILQFFRKPTRTTVVNPNHIIAPCDGKVVVIEEVIETEYFNGPRRQISIFMSPLNVHINWNPIAGVVQYFKYHKGKYLVAWHPKSSTENERTTTVLRSPSGVEVLFRQVAGALAKRIVWYVQEGQQVAQGSEMGFIKFGSRVDVYVPLDAIINVNLEEKTTGGETILAILK